ncbi:alpha/beta fold hydrolase [Pistricoccus aurantiacus]|uniref:alpha/beta fold hydrolase n=1 Tax=Pistricoccus aurantiacus TaxID=1883414 RepID=UPI003636156D
MGLELHSIDSGGDGTPLVVIHGLLGSADNWRSLLKQWQRRYRTVAIDLRNHGRSPHAAGMSYAAMTEDVLAVLDKANIERCHLLGHSMGGKVAMSIARLAPERLASLIVADIAPVTYGHYHNNIFEALRRVERARPDSRQQVDELMAETIDDKDARLFLATNLMRSEPDGVLVWRVGLDEIEADYEEIRGEPAGEGSFDKPSLILRGSRSSYVTDDMLPKLRQILPQAQVVTLEASHWLHVEQPKAFLDAVDAFLDEVERQGA